MCQPRSAVPPVVYPAVLLTSAAVIALELALMRCFQIATWSHLSYFVISTALLGFGVSGTFLTIASRYILPRWRTAMWLLVLAFAVSAPCCFQLAQALPIDIRQIPYRLDQAALLIVAHLLLLIPFFFGAAAIGLALTIAGSATPVVYAANMVGSGAGAAAAIALMFLLPPEQLLWCVAAAAAAAAMCCVFGSYRRLAYTLAAVAAAAWVNWPIALRIDPYKPLAQMRLLAEQGDARHLATFESPRGRLDVFDSPRSHLTLFASPIAPLPPPQLTVLIDAAVQLPLFLVDSAEQTAILDYTPMALPYQLTTPDRVLLLGEAGGTNIWLARRHHAAAITVVNPDPRILDLMRRSLVPDHSPVLSHGDHVAVAAGLRAFVEQTQDRYDLIQLCALEAMTAGSRGLAALTENFLVTTAGLARCLDRLTDRGLLCVTRGLQEPPRDNVKLLATMAEALEQAGIAEPGNHLIQVRNYLAACTIASRSPLGSQQIRHLRQFCDSHGLDVIWYPGITADQPNRFAVRPGPPGRSYDYYHHAARQILSPQREGFYDTWAFNVRPATDDRPYFLDFWKWRALPVLRQAFGRHWLARAELGYLALVAVLVESALVAVVLILLPLRWLRSRTRQRTNRGWVLLYFGALGLGYMFLEMALISRFTRFMGDPIYSAAVVLAAFLIFSGLGSFLTRRSTIPLPKLVALCVGAICLLGVSYLLGMNRLFAAAAGVGMPARVAISVALLAPLAMAMGVPFPHALTRLHGAAAQLVPWAWAVNGFASVIATSLAVCLATSIGFAPVLLSAVALYLLAAAVAPRLPAATTGG